MPAIEVPDWYRTVALVGQDATGTPVVVLLDSTGAIISIMKATYSGVLKNVACDDQGRMIMIPTDPADVWGNAISMGNAELAARLTGVGIYDRRGDIFFVEDFENGIANWSRVASGTGGGIYLSTTYSKSKGYSMAIQAPTDAGYQETANISLFYPNPSKIGVVVSFTLHADVAAIRLEVMFYDGITYHHAGIEYDEVNTQLEYKNAAGSWIAFETDLNLSKSEDLFHTAKLVVNMKTQKYVRFLLDDNEWDTSAYSYYTVDSSIRPYMRIWLSNIAVDNSQPTIYFDNVIVTQNEPA